MNEYEHIGIAYTTKGKYFFRKEVASYHGFHIGMHEVIQEISGFLTVLLGSGTAQGP